MISSNGPGIFSSFKSCLVGLTRSCRSITGQDSRNTAGIVPNWQQFATSEQILQAIDSLVSCIELARGKKFAKSSQGSLKNSNHNSLRGWRTEVLQLII